MLFLHVDQQILWFNVAVHDLEAFQVRERPQQLVRVEHDEKLRHGAARGLQLLWVVRSVPGRKTCPVLVLHRERIAVAQVAGHVEKRVWHVFHHEIQEQLVALRVALCSRFVGQSLSKRALFSPGHHAHECPAAPTLSH